jgi:HEAT repeat protein
MITKFFSKIKCGVDKKNADPKKVEVPAPSFSFESLMEELKASWFKTRGEAVEYLGELGDKRAVEPLLNLLETESEAIVQFTIIGALGKLGDKRVVDHIIKFLHHEDIDVRWKTMETLALFSDKKGMEAVIEVLNDNDPLARSYAILYLEEFKSKEAIPFLEKVAREDNEENRATAMTVIAELNKLP